MIPARWILLLGGIAISALATALLWMAGIPAFFLFLLFPFLLWPIARRNDSAAPPHTAWRRAGTDHEDTVRVCTRCGQRSRDRADRFCPRDGAPLHPS